MGARRSVDRPATPAATDLEGASWRTLAEGQDVERLARGLACGAAFVARGAGDPPPVRYTPSDTGWIFTATDTGRMLAVATAVERVDKWATARGAAVRSWVWKLALATVPHR